MDENIELKREDLNEEMQVVADRIGMEKTKVLLETFGGMKVYFPNRSPRASAARRHVRNNLDKQSVSEMARKTGMSRQSIFKYLSSKNRRSR